MRENLNARRRQIQSFFSPLAALCNRLTWTFIRPHSRLVKSDEKINRGDRVDSV